jgi:hypothetical protein
MTMISQIFMFSVGDKLPKGMPTMLNTLSMHKQCQLCEIDSINFLSSVVAQNLNPAPHQFPSGALQSRSLMLETQRIR